MTNVLPPRLRSRLETLADASYQARDELTAAAASLDDDCRRNVCQHLADQLARNAIELEQMLKASGQVPTKPDDAYDIAESFFHLAKQRGGESGVLHIAENCERSIKRHISETLDSTSNHEALGVLQRHRDEVEFAEHVLKTMQDAPPPVEIPSVHFMSNSVI